VSRAGYYEWRHREPSERAKQNVELVAEIVDVFEESRRTYGSPRVHAELRERGFEVSRKRVEKQMREQGLVGCRRPRFRRTTDSNHDDPIAPNIVAREFHVDEPDRVWIADISVPQKAAREMRVDPSQPACRSRLQTTTSGLGQKPWS